MTQTDKRLNFKSYSKNLSLVLLVSEISAALWPSSTIYNTVGKVIGFDHKWSVKSLLCFLEECECSFCWPFYHICCVVWLVSFVLALYKTAVGLNFHHHFQWNNLWDFLLFSYYIYHILNILNTERPQILTSGPARCWEAEEMKYSILSLISPFHGLRPAV